MMTGAIHNLLFQQFTLADDSDEFERNHYLSRVPAQKKIDAFLRSTERLKGAPQFMEFHQFQIAMFVAAAWTPGSTRVVVCGVTGITQDQFDVLAASIGRGTNRWNRLEFKDSVETILGIKIADYSGQYRV
jgi:hypothetical protein